MFKIDELFSLQGKTAIVTGASRGLGKKIALALGYAGANLVLSARNKELLEKTEAEAKESGIQALSVCADTRRSDEIQVLAEKTVDTFGQIDVLVNNAGVGWMKPFLEFKEEDLETIIDVNVKGYLLCTRAVLPFMIEREKGSIINLSSVTAQATTRLLVPYATSKGAVSAMTHALAVEFAQYNIRVNAIAPSFFETDMTSTSRTHEKANQRIIDRTPIGRWGKAEDLCGVAILLASDASSFITGEVINVDGGWTSA